MIKNLTQGFGDHGSFAEGDGTGVMSSHIIFLPALQAWRVAGGLDYTTPRPNARWTVLKFVMLTIAKNGQPDIPCRGGYPHNVWSREGLSGPGTFCSGFGIVNDREKPALMWLYNYASKALDQKAEGPYETASIYPHRAILSFINWPIGLQAQNPSTILPKLVVDEWSGRCMFRNRWQDSHDILVDAQLKTTRGWMSSGAGTIYVWGLGKRAVFPMRMKGEPTVMEPSDSGGVVSTQNQSLGVDFSGASGAEALVVMTGSGEAAKTPGQATTVLAGSVKYTLMILAEGDPPIPIVDGDKVVVGGQTISFDGTKIVFEK